MSGLPACAAIAALPRSDIRRRAAIERRHDTCHRCSAVGAGPPPTAAAAVSGCLPRVDNGPVYGRCASAYYQLLAPLVSSAPLNLAPAACRLLSRLPLSDWATVKLQQQQRQQRLPLTFVFDRRTRVCVRYQLSLGTSRSHSWFEDGAITSDGRRGCCHPAPPFTATRVSRHPWIQTDRQVAMRAELGGRCNRYTCSRGRERCVFA